tara:strand:+ start:3694 stop:4005 length:312 start_codon:yes stop_codon:yes gene_type:complete
MLSLLERKRNNMTKLNENDIRKKLKYLEGWDLVDRQIERNFTFDTFLDGIDFVNKISKIAEEQNHHPDLDIRYNKIKCRMMSHDVSSITDRDFNLAQALNFIY